MGMTALQGVIKLGQAKKKTGRKPLPVPKPVQAEVHEAPDDESEAKPKIIRIPRVASVKTQKRVDILTSGESLSDNGKLGKSIETQARRQEVTAWMLNGHTHEGELCDVATLAIKLHVPKVIIDRDIKAIKERMAEFYTKDDDTRDIAALAHMLLEMKFRDRGQALALYNRVLEDLAVADAEVERRKIENRFSKQDGFGAISGRDRAAMYSTALAAIDLANRTTNGMESLLKLTGGAQKLQLIIKAKNVQLNKGNGTFNMEPTTIQSMIANMMGNVLPSNRGQDKSLPLPGFLEFTDEDKQIMSIAQEKPSKKGKVIDAQS